MFFIIIQSEISRIICSMAFMYAWAWTSIFLCVNTQQAVCYRFHSIWIYFPTEASLDLVVWYFYSYSCLNTDGPIVLQSAEWMQLLWLNKDTGTIQPSTSHLWSSPLIWHLWWPFFSFSQVSTLLARRLTVYVLSQTWALGNMAEWLCNKAGLSICSKLKRKLFFVLKFS